MGTVAEEATQSMAEATSEADPTKPELEEGENAGATDPISLPETHFSDEMRPETPKESSLIMDDGNRQSATAVSDKDKKEEGGNDNLHLGCNAVLVNGSSFESMKKQNSDEAYPELDISAPNMDDLIPKTLVPEFGAVWGISYI